MSLLSIGGLSELRFSREAQLRCLKEELQVDGASSALSLCSSEAQLRCLNDVLVDRVSSAVKLNHNPVILPFKIHDLLRACL